MHIYPFASCINISAVNHRNYGNVSQPQQHRIVCAAKKLSSVFLSLLQWFLWLLSCCYITLPVYSVLVPACFTLEVFCMGGNIADIRSQSIQSTINVEIYFGFYIVFRRAKKTTLGLNNNIHIIIEAILLYFTMVEQSKPACHPSGRIQLVLDSDSYFLIMHYIINKL